jgi:hypothetical protein
MSRNIESILRRNTKYAKLLDDHIREQIRREIPPLNESHPTRRKYNNQPVVNLHGDKFDSKLEERVYQRLCALYGRGMVFRQVSIPLGGGVRIRPDFMVIEESAPRSNSGECYAFPCVTVCFYDAKGHETEAFRTKRRILASRGIEITLLRK